MKRVVMAIGMASIICGCICGCASVQTDYEQAKQQNTPRAYQRFLTKHPQSEYTEEVRQRMEEFMWAMIKGTRLSSVGTTSVMWGKAAGTYQGGCTLIPKQSEKKRLHNEIINYQSYLRDYPDGTHQEEAKSILASLQEKVQDMKARQERFKKEVEDAKGLDAMEALLSKDSESKGLGVDEDYEDWLETRGVALANCETILVDQINKIGIGKRYCVEELRPDNAGPSRVGPSGRFGVSIKGDKVEFSMETPRDLFSSVGVGVLAASAEGSVHRFNDIVTFKSSHGVMGCLEKTESDIIGYKFINEGDPNHRLTFYLTKEHGYVYLRGKGRVIPKGGTEVKLGY